MKFPVPKSITNHDCSKPTKWEVRFACTQIVRILYTILVTKQLYRSPTLKPKCCSIVVGVHSINRSKVRSSIDRKSEVPVIDSFSLPSTMTLGTTIWPLTKARLDRTPIQDGICGAPRCLHTNHCGAKPRRYPGLRSKARRCKPAKEKHDGANQRSKSNQQSTEMNVSR